MKNLIFRIFFVLSLVVAMSSCESYLDPGYDEYLDESEVFSSYNYSLGYVRTVYSYLPGSDFGDAYMSDEAKHSDETSPYLDMNNGSWTSRSYVGGWTWSHYYAGVRRVHIFLDNVDKAIFVDKNTLKLTPSVNDTLRKQFKAEVKFLRAFYYFELLKRFGDPSKNLGVPIVPEKVLAISDTIDFARSSYDECVNYIVRDCDEAASVLPIRWSGPEYGRASKASALALKSRLLLYAASPYANPTGDVEKWKAAAAAAAAIINLKTEKQLPAYSLIPKVKIESNNMLPIFTDPSSTNNPEVIFSGPVTQTNDFEKSNLPPSFSGRGQINPTQDLVDAFETTLGYPITDTRSLYNPNNPYSRRDRRLEYFIAINGSKYGVAVKDETPASIAARTVDSYVGGKDGLNSSLNATKTGYYIRKFMDPTADIIQPEPRAIATHFWTHFRFAEILLNYAEAMAEAYGVTVIPAGYPLSAYDALIKIRERAGLTSKPLTAISKDDFIQRVRNERRVELCFEGHRFWDVRRWKQGETYFNAPVHGMKITKNGTSFTYEPFVVENRVFDSKMYVMPIPYSEIQKSKLLIQNEGW